MFLKKHKQKSNSVFLGLYYNCSIDNSRVDTIYLSVCTYKVRVRIFSHALNKLVSQIIWCIISDTNCDQCQKASKKA